MDERQDGPEAGSQQGSQTNHWHKLAESLGAKSPVEQPATPATTPAPATTTTDKKKVSRDRLPKPQPSKSHWRTLASMLGIGGANAEEESVVDETAAEAQDQVHVESPSPSFSADVTPRKPPSEVAGSRPGTPGGLAMRAPEPATGAGPSDQAAENEAAAGTPLAARDASADNLAALGLEFEPDEDDISRSKAQSVLESLFQPSPTPFWEEPDGKEEDVDSVRFERQEDVEFADEETEQRAEPTVASDQRSERSGRGRRGRSRRRRRGRPREESTADVLDANFVDEPATPSDSTLRLEASADLFDKTNDEDEEDEFEQTSEYDLIVDEDQAAPTSDRGREKKRITSWEEAIGVIVERNLQNRPASSHQGGSSRPPRGRRRQ